MPGHEVHLYIDRLHFWRTFPKLHKEIDKMVRTHGRAHRIFFHDDVWARDIAIRLYPGDPDAIKAAWLHLWIDDVCTMDPEYRKLLELKAKEAKKQRKWANRIAKRLNPKKTKKRRRKKKDPLLEALKKIYNI